MSKIELKKHLLYYHRINKQSFKQKLNLFLRFVYI